MLILSFPTMPVLATFRVAADTPVMTLMSSPPPTDMGTIGFLFLTWFVATLERECMPVAPVIPVMTLILSSSTVPVMTRLLLFVFVLGFDLGFPPPGLGLAADHRFLTLRRLRIKFLSKPAPSSNWSPCSESSSLDDVLFVLLSLSSLVLVLVVSLDPLLVVLPRLLVVVLSSVVLPLSLLVVLLLLESLPDDVVLLLSSSVESELVVVPLPVLSVSVLSVSVLVLSVSVVSNSALRVLLRWEPADARLFVERRMYDEFLSLSFELAFFFFFFFLRSFFLLVFLLPLDDAIESLPPTAALNHGND
mmetsp:Transcript_32464/g.68275  ORF Transcript_32464/g.68275 Transcript_32464/m.68275 type:complete len:305 (-) Transcript_32464:1415-2329(-)